MKYVFNMAELAELVIAELKRRGAGQATGQFKVVFHVHATSPMRVEAVANEIPAKAPPDDGR